MFQLTSSEFEILKSQIVTSSWGGTRKLPFAFTEQGVAMLSSVLKSKKAIQVNIQIMLVFSKVRELFVDSLRLKLDIEEIKRRLANQDKNPELVFTYLDELIEKQTSPPPRRQIGYKRKSDVSMQPLPGLARPQAGQHYPANTNRRISKYMLHFYFVFKTKSFLSAISRFIQLILKEVHDYRTVTIFYTRISQ